MLGRTVVCHRRLRWGRDTRGGVTHVDVDEGGNGSVAVGHMSPFSRAWTAAPARDDTPIFW